VLEPAARSSLEFAWQTITSSNSASSLPPVSTMRIPGRVTMTIISVRLVSVTSKTDGRISTADRFPVTVAVRRRVGSEIRKALRERYRCRAQDYCGCQSNSSSFHGSISLTLLSAFNEATQPRVAKMPTTWTASPIFNVIRTPCVPEAANDAASGKNRRSMGLCVGSPWALLGWAVLSRIRFDR